MYQYKQQLPLLQKTYQVCFFTNQFHDVYILFLFEATRKTINQMTTDIMKTSSTSENGLTPSE